MTISFLLVKQAVAQKAIISTKHQSSFIVSSIVKREVIANCCDFSAIFLQVIKERKNSTEGSGYEREHMLKKEDENDENSNL